MRSPCDSCAFRKGSVTHDKEADNRLRGLITALSGVPFYCHKSTGFDYKTSRPVLFNGKMLDISTTPATVLQPKVCAGWLAQVQVPRGPENAGMREELRMLGRQCLMRLDNWLGASALEEKAEAFSLLRWSMRRLNRLARRPIHEVEQ